MKPFICYLFLIACVLVILLQGFHPLWGGHMVFDFIIFRERAIGNFTNNEYQPGALLFFSLFAPFVINQAFDTFKIAFFIANIALIFLIGIFIQKISKPENIIILGLIILFTGPIILFRFELLVIFLVIASFFYFKKSSVVISSILLTLAIMVKVYPMIYVPYLVINLYQQRKIRQSIYFSLVFIATATLFLLIFMNLYQLSFFQLLESLRYHSLKPVGLEGFWSTVISVIHVLTTGSPPTLAGEYLTWGISRQDMFLPMWFFDNFWIFTLGLLYLFYLEISTDKKFNEIFLITVTLATIIFSKLSAPQYLIWFIFLLPLIDFEKFIHNTRYNIILMMSLVAAFLTQYIYPLNYDGFLSFFSGGSNIFLFYIFVIKNLLLLIIFYLLITLKDE